MSKHLRLPNGFGQITELKNKRLRNRFRVMVTVGKTETGKPICKILKPQGYFKTYNEAYEALIKYHADPYSFEASITVSELYEKWTSEYFKTIAESSKRTIRAAWAYCTSVYDMEVANIRVGHIKSVMAECDKPNTRNRIKSLFNLLLDYAVEHDIVTKNYARDFKIDTVEVENIHKSFTTEEMNKLWANMSVPFVSFVLYQCYSGWRPQELCNIKLEDVNINEKTVKGGMKTKAGKNRVVPICDKILPVVKKIYELSSLLGSEYLVCDNQGNKLTYDKYYKRFQKVMQEISIADHSPHDPRKHFVTTAKSAGIDEYAIKRVVGHSIDDITEKVYTDRDLEWLKSEINKIS